MSGWGCVTTGGLWCPRIRGGVADGSHGDGGLIRKIPDRGGVLCCRVGLCGIGEGVSDLGVILWLVCLGVWVSYYFGFVHG